MQNPPELQNHNSAFSDTTSEVIVGHLPRGYWWLVLGWLLYGFVFAVCAYLDAQMMRNLSGRIVITSILLLFFWLPGLWMAWLVARIRVLADENGLRWRGVGGWKSARWMQVRDFYLKVNANNKKSVTVETENGVLNFDNLTHGARLKQAVQDRARWTNTKSWEERGKVKDALELSAPETFTVDPNRIRDFCIMLILVVLVVPLLMLFKANTQWSAPLTAFRAIEETWQTMGALWGLGLIFMLALPGLLYGFIVFAGWPVARESRRQRGQTLTLSPHGLLWRDPKTQREIQARWEEVRDFYVGEVPGWVSTDARCVVETTRGTFDAVAMRNGARLRALIQKYCAAHGLQQKWESQRRRARSTPVAAGAQLYSYRHPETRALLWFAIAMMIATWFAFPMRVLGLMPQSTAGDPGEWVLGMFFVSITTIGCAWFGRNYFCHQIQTDEKGITQRCGRRTKFIAWPDVREYEVVSGYIVVRSDRETIRFLGMIGAQRQLQKFIAFHATQSQTRTW